MYNTLVWEIDWKDASLKNEEHCRVVLRYIFQGSGACPFVGFGISNVECLFGVFLPQRWFYIYIPRYGFHNLKLVLL